MIGLRDPPGAFLGLVSFGAFERGTARVPLAGFPFKADGTTRLTIGGCLELGFSAEKRERYSKLCIIRTAGEQKNIRVIGKSELEDLCENSSYAEFTVVNFVCHHVNIFLNGFNR